MPSYTHSDDTLHEAAPAAVAMKGEKTLKDLEEARGAGGGGEKGEIIVDWEGEDDPENPLNWTFNHKWAATAIVSAFTFISPVSSSMVSPAVGQIGEQFGIHNHSELALTISVFVLAYAVGPFLLGPLSEIFGRTVVLQLSNLFYLAFNIGCAFSQNKGQLIAFRFLSGLGGSAPLSIGGGLISDMWRPRERGQAIALYSLAPMLGPAVGPLAGGWIAERTTWRWCFWSTSIATVVIQALGLLFLQETYHPVLLERKARKLCKELGLPKDDTSRVRTKYESAERHWQSIFRKSLCRPFVLGQQPIVIVLGTFMAFVYGLIYLVLTTIPTVFQTRYHQSVGISSLHYIALGIGFTGMSQLNARLMDPIYKKLSDRNGGQGKPEFRMATLLPGAVMLPVGLTLYGWGAEKRVHWILPDIGLVLIAAGMIIVFQSIQTYVIDTYALHAASALAAVNCLRSLCGFGFPLFAPAMYSALGYGWGNELLAFLAVAIGIPAGPLIFKYGERLRLRSSYAHRKER